MVDNYSDKVGIWGSNYTDRVGIYGSNYSDKVGIWGKKCGVNMDPRERRGKQRKSGFFLHSFKWSLLQLMLVLKAMHTCNAYPRCCLASVCYTTLLDQGFSRPV